MYMRWMSGQFSPQILLLCRGNLDDKEREIDEQI